MDESKLPLLKDLYEEVKQSESYKSRNNKLKVVPVFKKIILETLQNEPLTNEHLTGLIHMFKHDCSADNFDKYLAINIPDTVLRNKLSDEAYEANENGFTNAGKRAIQTLTNEDLLIVKKFLNDAFKMENFEEAAVLCKEFIQKNIPIVTEGIYSPWLFYINPKIFPLVNDGIKEFKLWIKLSKNYDENIIEFKKIANAIEETNMGLVDALTTKITKDGELYLRKQLNLNGHSIYKTSHGIFSKKFRDSGIWEILAEKKWVCLHEKTGKRQGEKFVNELQIGDYVYVCYGGDELSFIGKIKSNIKPLPKELKIMLEEEDQPWIYREVDVLFEPKKQWLSAEMKQFRDAYMPSANYTFAKVPELDLNWINSVLFIPYYNVEVIGDVTEEGAPNTENDTINTKSNSMADSKNTILYGPPGTGKTFHSINHAVAIVENKIAEEVAEEDRELVKKRFDQYVKDGQIVFCTFHQSLSYEDFIEGIKPLEPETEDEQLYYAVEDGIFKRLCTDASFSFVKQQTNADTEKALDFSTAYDLFVDNVNENFSKAEKTEIPTRSGGNVMIESISQKNNIWVRHLDGNRKYTVSKKRLSKLSQAFPNLSEVTNINDQFRAEIGGSNSSAYWAVLNAIRKLSVEKAVKSSIGSVEKIYSYEDKKEIIESLKAENFKVENPKKFVLIIDEINRGNVSQIFGELITLIEDDKRLGREEALKTTLPYSKESFGVPLNLYIVGTMNTADRSVEALDTALRRRFSFVPKMPDESKLTITDDGIDLVKILQTINTRLRILKDNDHTIGHAWLWSVSNTDQLQLVFENKIIPLLQEYFYNDYEKLGLVLGDRFFKPHTQINSNVFAAFSGGNGLAGQYDQSWQYQLKSAKELTTTDFKSLEIPISKAVMDED
jgi:hypothetical protein